MSLIIEKHLKLVIDQKISEGVPEEFLPRVRTTLYKSHQTVYTGPPPKRKYKEENKPHRTKTYEEFKRIFEKVPYCKIRVEVDEHTGDPEWHDKIEQLDYERYNPPSFAEWDDLWEHALSNKAHLPMDWPME